MTRFDLFAHNGAVWVANNFPNHTPEDEEEFYGTWPVEVWVVLPDNGTWLEQVRERCTVLEDFQHDVEHTACRVSVPTPADFVWLATTVSVEEAVPAPLYA